MSKNLNTKIINLFVLYLFSKKIYLKKIIDKIIGTFRKKTYTSNTDWIFGNNTCGFETFKSYAYTCISVRAENISKAKIYIYKKEDESTEQLYEHPFLILIKKPNSRKQSFTELLYKITCSLDLYGNAYLYIQRDRKNQPAGLYFLPANKIKIILNDSMTNIEAYEYNLNTKRFQYKASDIIHFQIPDPDNNIEGKSIISAFNLTLETDYLQNLYQRNFYKLDSSIGLIIESENNIDDTQIQRLKNMITTLYEGADNAGRTLILESGIKAKSYRNSPKDVEILPSRKAIRDEILSIFRVPKTILGISDDVNRANARESLRSFYDNTIKPFARLCIESKLNVFITENYGSEFFIEMDYSFEIDRELQLKAIEIYSKYNIATKDEIREMEGFGKEKQKK
ncbi:MAG: phage portal protein [Ignavibacteria bacterium]|nr:phage portal protein [Ignavibacteria bacterium]